VTGSYSEIEVFERRGYVEARYLGAYSLVRFKSQMAESVRACIEKGQTLLLVDIRRMTEFAPPMQERFEIGRYGAEVSKDLSKVAVLGTDQQFEEKFASLVARNRGLRVQTFTDPAAAIDWLFKED
jgi:stage II sporulation SpoAA-like protein